MLPLKTPLAFKLKMRFSNTSKILVCIALLLCVLINAANAESRTPARVLAKQAGATQFEEERYETNPDCNEHKHHLKKRASDEDVDYEVYQGVVGRPGIDFPIYPRIPKTSFSCRSFGNGYFADMDTDCQVFHICEEGRKISFLCPNGTIFQQSELTCDWWFKVNCLGSPGYYADSVEILNKQRLHRVRPSVPVKGFNIVGGGLNIKPKINNIQPRTQSASKSERRSDSSEQQPSVETVDFEDISGEKHLKGQPRKVISNIDSNSNDNDNESQITAETASFVGGRNRNSYTYPGPGESRSRSHSIDAETSQPGKERGTQRNAYSNSANTESTERAKNGQRGQQRYKEEEHKKPSNDFHSKNNNPDEKATKKTESPQKLVEATTTVNVPTRGKGDDAADDDDVKPEYYDDSKRTQSSSTGRTTSTSNHHNPGTYSTARKLDNTRTTPFYTPTIPTVLKSKTTEGKSSYAKGKISNSIVATTPNPNRLNGNGSGSGSGSSSGLFPESSVAPKTTSSGDSVPNNKDSGFGTTFRPFIIGMRHNHDGDISSAEVQRRLSLGGNKPFNVDDSTLSKFNKNTESRDYLPTTPAPTGPTYLPKHSATPKGSPGAAGDDVLLFAPNPVADDTVSRNLDEMLKTVHRLKSELTDAEDIKGTGPARNGLEIPPSSGPDVLISLAKYFATEQGGSGGGGGNNANSLTTNEKKKATDKSAGGTSKLSDTTTSITTAATPRVAVKNDDIKVSLLSERTVDRYTSLFGLNDVGAKGKKAEDASAGLLSNNNNNNETGNSKSKDVHTPFPQIGSTDATIRELAQKPETKQIAQIFSSGLTKYLENPTTFRKQLESVRPTEPPGLNDFTPNFTPVPNVNDKALFRSGTAASYLPTKPTSAIRLAATTTQSNIAVEINDKFDASTLIPDLLSTTEQFDTTTYRPAHGSFEHKHKLELSAELSPLSPESGEGEEFLHPQQTQSFVKSRNELNANQGSAKKTARPNGAYTALPKTTENPWNSISQTDFLDPLTINDGLMKETKTTTITPFTYLPKDSTTPQYTAVRGNLKVIPGRSGGSRSSYTSAEVTTQRSNYQRVKESDSWRDILTSYDLPLETLPSSNGLQRIANRLFGGLNETEALHLKNVMQQAEHNRQVLRLLLLLIQTCDDQNGKALERSRKHLLNALIDMDGKIQDTEKGKTSHHKNSGKPITTTYSPVGTTKRDDAVGGTSTLGYPTTTDLPTTTTSGSIEETTKFEIRVEDPEDDQVSTATNLSSSSDRRALELLKSLYSLASKFTSSR